MSANVKQCRQCNKIFQSFGAEICPECASEQDKAFNVIKNYLYEHQDANVMDIVNETGIDERTVLGFLREGRLAADGAPTILTCEECGVSINSGTRCSRCQRIMESLLGEEKRIKADKNAERKAASARIGKMHMDYRTKW